MCECSGKANSCNRYVGFDIPADSYFHLFKRNILPGSFNGILSCLDQTKAAGDFHKGDGYALNRICLKDGSQFLPIQLDVIQFRATHHHGFSFKKILMEVRVSKRDTVGCDQ